MKLLNIATLALLGYVSLVGAQQEEDDKDDTAGMMEGPCPKFKAFDLDIGKLANKHFQLLYGERDSNGGFCIENRILPFEGGKNASRWSLETIQRVPQELIDGQESSKGQYLNFNNDEFVLVIRDEDLKRGVNNEGHIFRTEEIADGKGSDLTESTMGMQWRIVGTDYDKYLYMSACFEKKLELNADGMTKDQVEKARWNLRQVDYKEYVASEAISVLRENMAFKDSYIKVIEMFKREKQSYEVEWNTLNDAIQDDYQSTVIMKDIDELVKADRVPWEQHREWMLMPLEDFKKVYEPAKANIEKFLEHLEKNTYLEEFDENYDVKKHVHDHILHAFVSDKSQFEDDAAFQKVKADLFDHFEANQEDYIKAMEERNIKREDSEHCPHLAEKKSLFEFPYKTSDQLREEHGQQGEGEEDEEPQVEFGEPGEDDQTEEPAAEELSQQKDDL